MGIRFNHEEFRPKEAFPTFGDVVIGEGPVLRYGMPDDPPGVYDENVGDTPKPGLVWDSTGKELDGIIDMAGMYHDVDDLMIESMMMGIDIPELIVMHLEGHSPYETPIIIPRTTMPDGPIPPVETIDMPILDLDSITMEVIVDG